MNLDHLKGTGLLVRGFEEFVAKWTGHEDSFSQPVPYEGEAATIWELLPDQVRQFYALVNRIPESNICGNRNQDSFISPPRYQKKWSNPDWIIDRRFATLAIENQGNWEVVLALDGPDAGKLFCDRDKNGKYPGEWQPMDTPVEEFLVTLGFHELVMTGASLRVSHDSVLEDAAVIFHGHYASDEPINSIFHADGHLWLADEKNRPFRASSKRTLTRHAS